MPIGSYMWKTTGRPAKRAFRRFFGTLDLHSHTRLRPVFKYLETTSAIRMHSNARVLERGCGAGTNLLELAQRFPTLTGTGYDLNDESVALATDVANRLFPTRLNFVAADARGELPRGEFDLVLLIDFLEHVAKPEAIMRVVSGLLCKGGEVLVSVPTPRFPRIFGQRFHKLVGHLVAGYDLSGLNALIPNELELVAYRYNTGLVASAPCALYYRIGRTLPQTALVKLFLASLHCLRAFDCLNGPGRSCSLFAAYRKS